MNRNQQLIGLLMFSMSLLVACGNEPEPKETETTNKVATRLAKETEAAPKPMVQIDKSNPNWKQNLELPTLYSFEAEKSYYWDMQTNKGEMSFKLYHESAPMHATSTIFLTKMGFYDDVIFHRIIPGFMAQGGDPTGTGRAGPGYQYDGEFDGSTSHTRPGLLSMANAGPGTDGSQFFITFEPTVFLDGKHTIFGELVTGEATLKQLEEFGSRSGATSERIVIKKATIRIE
ncbi:MAG: peptidyl-prolyl cis-trans isomerase B (cyclophilin B) [Halieaceae bacterium]|jgi:peptidyl-prolyl cis-trans isomerase B (cyclophilin B)